MYNWETGKNNYYLKSIDEKIIRYNCKKHINISEQDIQEIVRFSKMLPIISDLEGCDVFIDCFTNDPDVAIVVAQCSPHNTLYSQSFIGEFIFRKSEPAVFRTFELGVPSKEIKAIIEMKKSHTEVLVKQNVVVLLNKDFKKIGVLITEKNLISSGQQNIDEFSQALNLTVSPLINPYAITKLINDSIICFNKSGIAIFANDSAKRLYKNLEYKDNIVGMSFENLVFGNFTFEDVLEKSFIEQFKVKISKYYLNIVYSKINEGNEYIGVSLIIRDVTEKYLAEKELVLKSAAIDEMHHRIKNNLQTIISLIRLQEKRFKNRDVTKVCEQIISRIYSISLTHEILSKKGIDVIDLHEMLSIMTNNIRNYISQENLNLDIKVNGQNVSVASDIGCTVAMIINELLQNSIKYAWPDIQNGKILINILQKNKVCSIVFIDNGVGFEISNVNSSSLGIKLIKSLVSDKLFGDIVIKSSSNGTRVTFSFAIEKFNF